MSIKKRVAILISGRGSNMQSLVQACAEPDYPCQVVGVLSNKSDAPGLLFAKSAGIPTAVVAMKDYPSKHAADAAISATLKMWQADIVCLAGFMRILSPEFCAQWEGRMINIHPSLLPAYPGLHTHQRAIDDGAKTHGCSVHFVTAGMDEGPVIAQREVPVLPQDTADALAARVLVQEHLLYPEALAAVATGKASFSTADKH